MGLRFYKVGMPIPLEPERLRQFAEGLEEVIVVEEKRPIIEGQMKEQLYGWPADKRRKKAASLQPENCRGLFSL